MGIFKPSVLTEKGATLSAKAINGETSLQFTRIALGDSRLTDIYSLTDIGTVRQTENISSMVREDNFSIKSYASFSNKDLQQGYYIRAMGLYALDPDEGEILYCVSVADESVAMADWMPPFTCVGLTSLSVGMAVAVSSTTEVNVTVEDISFVTMAQLADYSKKDELNALEDAVVLSANTTVYVDSAIGDDTHGDGTKGNPYKTIQKAVDKCPTNTNRYSYSIVLAQGSYDEDVLIKDRCGSINITGGATLEDSDKFTVRYIYCSNTPYLYLGGIKFTGTYNQYSNIGLLTQASMVYVNSCKFNDCVVRALPAGEVNLISCDLSNYRSGSLTYGVAHANGGIIKCYDLTGTNNKAGYAGGAGSNTGGVVYFSSNCTLTADVLIREAFCGRVQYNSGRYEKIGSVTGTPDVVPIDTNLYTEFLVIQKLEVGGKEYAIQYNIIPAQTSSTEQVVTSGGASTVGTLVVGSIRCTNTGIRQGLFRVDGGDQTAKATMEVYARRT